MAPNPAGPCATECRLAEQHGALMKNDGEQDRKLEELFRASSRLPQWATLMIAALAGFAMFWLGAWITRAGDFEKLQAGQYEIRGAVDDLRKMVALELSNWRRGINGAKGEAGEQGPAGPAGPVSK